MGHIDLELSFLLLIAFGGFMSYFKLWPSPSSLHEVAELMNTKGGIILALGAMSLIFFFTGMRWLYWSTNKIIDGRLSADNALVLNGFNWISGAAFMGAFGAMLAAMKGEALPPAVPTTPGTTATVTQTTTAATTGNEVAPKPTPAEGASK